MGIPGRRRITFATAEEIAHEQRLIDEAAKEAAKERATTGRVLAEDLVAAALADGRARYELDIAERAGISHDTVAACLHRMRRRGDAERVAVGPAILWSLTRLEGE